MKIRRKSLAETPRLAQKPVEAALLECGQLPGNLELAHHNAVAGRDEWRDVRALIVVGRTMAPPADVERTAEALTGSAVRLLTGWYQRADAVRELNGAQMAAQRVPSV